MNGLPADLFDRKYSKLKLLGEGSYGAVFLCQDKATHQPSLFDKVFQKDKKSNSEFVAVKIYKKPNSRSEGIDFSCLREHPNLMNCIEVLINHRKEGNCPYEIAAVMDFHLEFKVLLSKFKGLHNQKKAAVHILKGLTHLHESYYIHRDLKVENVFVSREGYVKLADYGFTKQYGTPGKKYTINACTIEYRAPELFFGTHYYTEKSDIWSIGCILYYIFTDKTLFEVTNINVPDIDVLSQIFYLFGTPSNETWPEYDKFPLRFHFKEEKPKKLDQQLQLSEEVGDFLSFVMKLYPPDRPNARDILKHPFFKDVPDEPFEMKDIYDEKIEELISTIKKNE